ncbi:hypothetical protein [Prochlorococcus marinus]|uniref:hypothetical protein n=1 Tax=Prochlorococcus marinus TaxID=1219 RepID=UPI001ADBD258|nr:hypothetical protein [Prochlorococcus marinus]MBO8204585.1 hypothetical protein [Prochlorococcus marinus CUG1415]MBW3043873.1 hypothetical protein [Prochlorococcus marinus str. MU1415]
MKNKILPFIKKYPMSILLAIIALNLFSIAGSLKTSAKLDYKKLVCLEEGRYTKKQMQKKLGSKYYSRQCNMLSY